MEIKDKGNFQTKWHPRIPDDRGRDSKIIRGRKWRREKMNIYKGNSKAWDFLIIRLTDIDFVLVRQCDLNAHDAWKVLIGKYEVLDDNQESLNEVTNRCNNWNIKDTSIGPDIWFNELYNLNLKFKKIKEKNEKYKDKLKAHDFHILH